MVSSLSDGYKIGTTNRLQWFIVNSSSGFAGNIILKLQGTKTNTYPAYLILRMMVTQEVFLNTFWRCKLLLLDVRQASSIAADVKDNQISRSCKNKNDQGTAMQHAKLEPIPCTGTEIDPWYRKHWRRHLKTTFTMVGEFRASPTAALNLSAVKALCSTFHPCFAHETIFTSNRVISARDLYRALFPAR
jgi:hypothetical protein